MRKSRRSLEKTVPEFIQQVGKERPGNDRRYSRKVERLVKTMDPMTLAELLGQIPDEENAPAQEDRGDDGPLPRLGE
jgi:hypothetical protein